MRTSLAVVLAAAAVLPLGGCKRDLPPAMIVYARGADAESLDPQGVDDGESAKVINQLYEGLVSFNPTTMRLEPCLAESWTNSPDGLEWEFRLRKGVKFHDGTPLDAEAVVYTMRRFLDPAHPERPPKVPYESFFTPFVASVTAKGTDAVVFRLKEPVAVFLPNLSMFTANIVPPGAVKAAGGAGFGKKPVGTGPFRFVEWNEGEKKIVLERNPGYWRAPAAVEKVIFLTIPDNNARLTALRSGTCNWMDGMNPEDLEPVLKDAARKVWSATGFNVGYIALNTERKPFDDARVRRAVALAVGRKAIVDGLCHGMAVPAVHPMAPGTFGYDESVTLPAPDPAAAKRLLAEAGYPDGFDTVLFAMSNNRPYFLNPQKIAQVIRSDLAAAGIRVTIDTVGDWPQYREATSNAKHPMCLLGWTTDNGDPDNFLYTFFAKENAVKGPGALNVSFWVDPRMQDLLKRGQREMDPAKRAAIYRDALALVREEVPMVPVMHVRQVFVSQAGFEGFVPHPFGDVILYPVKFAPAP